jgi:hypothetical protein
VATEEDGGAFLPEAVGEAVEEVGLVALADAGFVVAGPEEGDVFGVGCIPIGGGVDESVEVVVALVFGTELVLVRSFVPFSLHGAEGVAEFQNRGADFLGFFVVGFEDVEAAEFVVPVFVGHEEDGEAAFALAACVHDEAVGVWRGELLDLPSFFGGAHGCVP